MSDDDFILEYSSRLTQSSCYCFDKENYAYIMFFLPNPMIYKDNVFRIEIPLDRNTLSISTSLIKSYKNLSTIRKVITFKKSFFSFKEGFFLEGCFGCDEPPIKKIVKFWEIDYASNLKKDIEVGHE